MLSPNVDDDCCLIAFAPLDEPTEPEQVKLLQAWPKPAPIYPAGEVPTLLLTNK
jgi:hypothetical protein